MRDWLLLAIFIGGALVALRRPWVGVMMWTWISLMNPHVVFGWSAPDWPVGTLVAVCTLLGLFGTRDRLNPMLGAPVWTLLAFTVWTCITLPFSVDFTESLPLWQRSMKIFLMVFITLALVDDRRKLDILIWVMVISLGFYGVKGGVFTLMTAGNYRVWGPGGFIGGNNEVALALVMTIPLMRYLQTQETNRWLRRGLGAAMALSAITVLGTYSRGAFLAIGAMSVVLWMKGSNKFLWGAMLLVMGAVSLSFMPEHWWTRMETIQTYQEDDSALGRINAWWVAWNLACDKFFGGGFAIYSAQVFARYAPFPEKVHAAHSIYFQVMGEHGFVGLALFLLVGAATWLTCRRLIRSSHRDPSLQWAGSLGAMLQVSMVGYAVGGAFLSLAYYDFPYDMMVVAALALRLARSGARAPALTGAAVHPPPRGLQHKHSV